MHTMRRPASGWLAAVLLPALAGAPAVAWGLDPEGEGRTISRDLQVQQIQEVRIDFPHGELEIESGEPGRVEVRLLADCERGGDRCRDRLERLAVESRSTQDALEIRIEGVPRHSSKGLRLRLRIRVPAEQRVDVDMGAGELRVTDLGRDLRVHLGAGEIEIRLPESAVGVVDLEAGVGETSLRVRGREVDGERRHLVGGSLHWDEGPGEAHVEAEVGAGEVQVRLD